MSILATLLAVGTMSLPDVSRRFMFSAMPAPVAGMPTAVEYFVDPDGVVIDCAVLSPHVRERRAADICDDAIGESVGSGATNHRDERAYGVVTLVSSTAGSIRDLPPDMEVAVSQMPGRSSRQHVLLMVSIDELGRVVQCMQMPQQDLELSQVACTQSQAHRFRVRNDRQGEAVGYVTALNIDFVRESDGD
ncbi:MAG: hypothetical protein KDE15_00745 [Erythrobacter sp.]|nr:hypothetical protein [Erythrobacter sp.]